MLRALVLLFVLVNAALYWWLQSDPQTLQSDREPQRLQRQVAPDAIQVLPDLPASGARGAPGPASAAVSSAPVASAADRALAPSAGASAATLALARSTVGVDVDCSETPGLDDARFAALRTALARGGLATDAIGERRQSQGGAWIVYLGRFTDAQAWQQKADELRKLDVKFERVNTPSTLAPGLSLGQFTSQADATKKLDALAQHGVHAARVVTLTAPTVLRHLQVRAADAGWHHAAGTQRFDACPLDGSSST